LDLLKAEIEKKEEVIDELTVEAKSAQDTVKQMEQELVQLTATLNETKSTVEGQREELNTANALTSKCESLGQRNEELQHRVRVNQVVFDCLAKSSNFKML
jgi:chromosome segregation ATPase